jgi:integrase
LYAEAKLSGNSKSATNRRWEIATIIRTPITLATGETKMFGDWLVVDVNAVALHAFRVYRKQRRRVPIYIRDAPSFQERLRRIGQPWEPNDIWRHSYVGGIVTANRNLALLSAVFNWAIDQGYIEKTPFKKGDRPTIRQDRETARSRRLESGEAERLLNACGPHLRALVEAALETGCRRGELLALQWHQVRGSRGRSSFCRRRRRRRAPPARFPFRPA